VVRCQDCEREVSPAGGSQRVCSRCRQRRQRYSPPGAAEAEQREAYYSILNEDANLTGDLRVLYRKSRPGLAQALKNRPNQTDLAGLIRGPYLTQAILGNQVLQRKLYAKLGPFRTRGPKIPPTEAIRISRFVATWHLPRRYGLQDVWASFWAAHIGYPLRLITSQREYEPLVLPPVVPKAPEPFPYDPNIQIPATIRHLLDQLTRQFREDLDMQIEDRRRQARKKGWGPLPPRYRNRADLRRMARRLYRRAVLGSTWKTIAEHESTDPQGVRVSVPTVRTSVVAWANVLDVPLQPALKEPPRKRG
jgi:hypothetical protein